MQINTIGQQHLQHNNCQLMNYDKTDLDI